jgi:hypothetical protein
MYLSFRSAGLALVEPGRAFYEGGAQDLLLAEDEPMIAIALADKFIGSNLSYSSTALPTGLSFNSDNGGISGTPTTAQSATPVTVTGANAFSSDSATFDITVTPIAPEYTGGAPDLVLTEDLPMQTASLSSFFTGPSIAWSASGLPTGVTINTANGNITGTPTTVQAATAATVTATNLGGSDDAVFDITVESGDPPPSDALLVASTFIYVDPVSGDNSNGRQAITTTAANAILAAKAAPMLTLQAAAGKVIPGTAVIAKAGNYNAASSTTRVLSLSSFQTGTEEDPIFFISETRHGAILNGPTQESAVRILDSEWVEIHGFRINGGHATGSDFNCVKVESASDESVELNLTVADCIFGGVGRHSVKAGTTSRIKVLGNTTVGNWSESCMIYTTSHNNEVAYNTLNGRLTVKGGTSDMHAHHNIITSNREAMLIGELGESRSDRPMPTDPPFPWAEAYNCICEYNHAKSSSTTHEPIWTRGAKGCIYRYNYCDAGVNNLRGMHLLRAASAFYQDATIASVPAADLPYIKTQGVAAPFDYYTWCRSLTILDNAYRTGATSGSLKDANQNNLVTESGWVARVDFEAAFPGVVIGTDGWDSEAAYFRTGLRTP